MTEVETILVTGGAGFVGSHACKTLARRGYRPVAYDNLSRGFRDAVKWGPLEVGDLADEARLLSVLHQHRPVAIMHFAAYAYVGESVKSPALYWRNNVEGSAAMLRAMLQYRPLPIVFSSTCAIYGTPEQVPILETHPQCPINPYGATKLAVESMLAQHDARHGLPFVALRYFNAAGADPDGEIGENHSPETHLIPLVLMAAREGTEVEIFGNDYDTPDGTCIRDYVHVADLADAHVSALQHLLSGGASVALNLANGRGYSVREVIAAAERVCRQKIKTRRAARRPGDLPILIGSADKARALLGWQPTRSELDTQIADAWNWLKT
jgi:UDP-arabinose 4-epimerase